ncbi:MAG: ATP-binding cassette domain-containing protein [Collinsella intestinalis]
MNLATGARLALRGASGAGKTTLCRVLAGQLMPSAGVVLVTASPSEMDGGSVRVGGSGLNDRPGGWAVPGRSAVQRGPIAPNGSRVPGAACLSAPRGSVRSALSLRASLAEAGDVDGPRAGHLMRIFSVEGGVAEPAAPRRSLEAS